jgi:hypothetical protein
MNPRSCLAGTPKTHFVGLSIMLYFLRLLKVSYRSAIRSSYFLDMTAMSSTYAWMLRPIYSARHFCMMRWYIAPVFFRPNGIVT